MGDELNLGLSFQHLNQKQQHSFYPSPAPVLARFEIGDRVWKWTGPGVALVNPKGKISEYWIPWNSLKV
jgi:hypothetical protein